MLHNIDHFGIATHLVTCWVGVAGLVGGRRYIILKVWSARDKERYTNKLTICGGIKLPWPKLTVVCQFVVLMACSHRCLRIVLRGQGGLWRWITIKMTVLAASSTDIVSVFVRQNWRNIRRAALISCHQLLLWHCHGIDSKVVYI